MPLPNTGMTRDYSIVGMRFRPPAQALVEVIPLQTTLWLVAEPTNPYDENAVKVIIRSAETPETCHLILNDRLEGFGYDLASYLAEPEWHIGYIPKGLAAVLREENYVPVQGYVEGEFCVDFNGRPMVRIIDKPYGENQVVSPK